MTKIRRSPGWASLRGGRRELVFFEEETIGAEVKCNGIAGVEADDDLQVGDGGLAAIAIGDFIAPAGRTAFLLLRKRLADFQEAHKDIS